jgi:hypothetical protein
MKLSSFWNTVRKHIADLAPKAKAKNGVPMISWTETRDGGSMNETVLKACFLR